MNSQLAEQADALVTDPCGAGWLAEVVASRDEDELKNCISRGMLVMAATRRGC